MVNIKLIGSKFIKITGERNPDFSGKLSLNQNIKIINLEKFKIDGTKQEALKVKYLYQISYADLGNIEIEGLLFLDTDSKNQKELIKNWKDKDFKGENHIFIMNLIVKKATIKAIDLEDELGLPIHFKLPSLQVKE